MSGNRDDQGVGETPSNSQRNRPKTAENHVSQNLGQPYAARPYGFATQQTGSADVGVQEISGEPLSQSRPPKASSAVRPPLRPLPTRLPKRDKGKWFIGGTLLLTLGFGLYTCWDSLFRYPIRGEIVGRVIKVPPPWAGTLRSLHVQDGQQVEQGELLATFSSLDREHRWAEVADQLRLAQAELSAQVSQMQWQSQLRGDRSQKALGEYYELWGELLHERSKLDQTTADLERYQATLEQNARAISGKQLEAAVFANNGQRAKVEKLEAAVDEMKKRVDIYDDAGLDGSAQIRPQLLRIELLQAELARIRQQLQQGEIRSPAAGRVVRVNCFAGEFADAGQPVIEIVAAGSMEAVLYVPQNRIEDLEEAGEVRVLIEPGNATIACRIERLGARMSPAPPSVERYYRSNERLLPVFLKPQRSEDAASFLRLGSEVRLSSWSRTPDAKAELSRRTRPASLRPSAGP